MKAQIQSTLTQFFLYGTLMMIVSGFVSYKQEPEIMAPHSISPSLEKEFSFQEEAEIGDIPFNTRAIVADYHHRQSLTKEFDFDDEDLIYDIPFNTKKIVAQYQYGKSMKIEFDLNDEALVDDIPFDTEKIAKISNDMAASK